MFNSLLQGIAMLIIYGFQILALVISGLGAGSIAALLLFDKRKYDERLVYVLLLGFVLVGIAAPFLKLIGLLNIYLIAVADLAGIAAFITLIRRGAFRTWSQESLRKYVVIPSSLFGFFLPLRLGYIQALVLPPFSDSAMHFKNLGGLLGLEYVKPYTWNNVFPLYHYGFHGITAWSDTLTGDTSPLTMAVTAHFFLAMLPAAIYLMALAFSEADIPSSVFGGILAGLGWITPAHAVNFGKYPTLTALSLLPLLFGLFHLSNKNRWNNQWLWRGYFVLIALGLVWIHSRLVAVLLFFLLAYYAARFLESKLKRNIFEIGTSVATFLLLFWIMFLNNNSGSESPFRYYLSTFDNSTFLVAALLPFVFRRNAALLLQWVIFITLLVVSTGMALPGGIYSYNLTLIDQPFFEISLFLPLAALGALGLNCLGKLLPAKEKLHRDVALFLIALVVASGALSPQPWLPMATSDYVTKDDLAAFKWMNANIPESSLVIISGIEKNDGYLRPTDSGSWVGILTGNSVEKIQFDFPWDSPSDIGLLCAKFANQLPIHVYVGQENNSFNIETCSGQRGLHSAFCRPNAKIFELKCSALAP